ncbi:hypothetical protein [Streptomyces sp. NPDC059063]|uniref:hypothetical protein n=1 Tax=Streptomyces sp. NPDC059063 TaxID=3346712 RepID=UPI003696C289
MTAQTRKPEKPKIAPDGVQEVRLTDARPLLTTLISDARETNLTSALTVRGKRKIMLVTPEWYEKAKTALGER